MKSFRFLFLSFTLIQHFIRCEVYEECEGISEPDVVVTSKKSCAKYVFCDGENSYEAECLIGFHFNEKTGSCDDPKHVQCDIKQSDNVQSIFDEHFSPTTIEQQTTKSEVNAESNENLVENGNKYIDLAEHKNNSSIKESNTESQNPNCPPLRGFNNIKNIVNSESCKMFYTCYNGHAISMLCPINMYFNENSAKCEAHMPESCKAKHSVRLNCVKGVYDFVPHPTRCEYYFYCVNGYLMIMRCPNNFTWHYERGTCVHKSKSKCFSGQNSFHGKNN